MILDAFIDQLSIPFNGDFDELLGYVSSGTFTFQEVQKIIVFDDEFNTLFSVKKAVDYELIAGWQGVNSRRSQFERETDEAFYFTAKVDAPYKGAESTYLMMVLNKPSLLAYADALFFTNAAIIIFLSLISVLAISIVVRRLIKPLEGFSSMMIQAASGETGLRTEYDVFAELGQMSEAFNQMMEMSEKRLEELEQSRDRAVKIAKIKSDFAANVSHEIRTPLNGILGMVNLLKEMGLPQHQHEYLDVASKSGDALLQMLNDVLDFSKIEGGHFELELKDLDLRLLLEQLALLYAEKVQAKDLELCLDLPTNDILFVRGDSTRIRQVVSNLLNNAIKFTVSGHITLSAHVLSNTNGRATIEISVSDTGVGISEKAQEQVFMPFVQVGSQASNENGGTGLGLTIVKQMVGLMGGEVSVSSTEAEGSCFSFVLPMQVHKLELEIPSSEGSLLQGKNVLLVEPFAETRHYMEGMLKLWGVSCHSVSSLEEAIASMKLNADLSSSPDICLFNVDYSGGSMSDFLAGFKANACYEKTKLIPMVRFGSKVTSVDEGGASFVASIDRPVRYEKLRMTLLDVFSDKKAPSQLESKEKKYHSDILQSKTVLVVDDNETNVLVATAMLHQLGVVADVANNGKEALNAFKKEHYDIVLMDFNMPVMGGCEATECIRSLDSDNAQPIIIALTAKDQQSDVDRCLASGMNGVLFKPFKLTELLAVLEQHMGCSLVNEPVDMDSVEVVEQGDVVIDNAVFDALALNTGEGIERIVSTYLIDTPIYVVTLVAAMEAGDTTKCLDLAHKIKGSSRNVGAEGLVSICSDIENSWSENNSDADADVIEKLGADLEEAFVLVETTLSSKLAGLDLSDSGLTKRGKDVILIVDDDQSTRMTVASVLEREGYLVEQGSNGREAVRLFDILRPNVIIMDAMMPIKDGFEACREIKDMPGGENIPILITTALESEKSVDLAFESGAADFVPKPINLSVLRQRVRRLLAKQSADQHVQKLAYIDSLTGLPNRAAFVEQFQQELEHAARNDSRTAIFFIDLDRFKNINDSLGHEAGDVLLKALSGRLSNCIRSSDMLARLGGDEFVVVLSNVGDDEKPNQIAQAMLKALKESFYVAGQELFATVSIGISMYPDDGLSKDTLLKNADTAMYRAKAAGRNTYCRYTQDMSEILEQRMRVETELRNVITDNELSLYYQPKQDVLTGQVIGSEALVRWEHRLRGMVSPAEFIPVAEEMGLIKEIGLWVLDQACETTKKWQLEHGYEGTVAVNVSAVQMEEDNFVELVETCLNKHQLEPKYLELEVTETMVLENVEVMLEMLNLIRSMGVSISIDDFGTGYSSFSYIKQLPANTLKLDMEFVQDIPESKADMAVVDGMIVLAHNLGMKVVSEGVETQEQYDFLAEHKCDLVQGYLISKPLSEQAFEGEYVALKAEAKELH